MNAVFILSNQKGIIFVLIDAFIKSNHIYHNYFFIYRSYSLTALFKFYLFVENVIGEAEWKTESRKCEGIIIDKYFPDLGPANLKFKKI